MADDLTLTVTQRAAALDARRGIVEPEGATLRPASEVDVVEDEPERETDLDAVFANDREHEPEIDEDDED